MSGKGVEGAGRLGVRVYVCNRTSGEVGRHGGRMRD